MNFDFPNLELLLKEVYELHFHLEEDHVLEYLDGLIEGDRMNKVKLINELKWATHSNSFDWIAFVHQIGAEKLLQHGETSNDLKCTLQNIFWNHLFPSESIDEEDKNQLKLIRLSILSEITENEGWIELSELHTLIQKKFHKKIPYFIPYYSNYNESNIEFKKNPIKSKNGYSCYNTLIRYA